MATGIDDLNEKMLQGEIKIGKAEKIAALPEDEQPAAIEAAKSPKKREPKPKPDKTEAPQPIGELRGLFDAMTFNDCTVVNRFAEWVMKQTNAQTIHEGCALWLEWK
jgi:hypothetical protein